MLIVCYRYPLTMCVNSFMSLRFVLPSNIDAKHACYWLEFTANKNRPLLSPHDLVLTSPPALAIMNFYVGVIRDRFAIKNPRTALPVLLSALTDRVRWQRDTGGNKSMTASRWWFIVRWRLMEYSRLLECYIKRTSIGGK